MIIVFASIGFGVNMCMCEVCVCVCVCIYIYISQSRDFHGKIVWSCLRYKVISEKDDYLVKYNITMTNNKIN